jgi:hypothetical protein
LRVEVFKNRANCKALSCNHLGACPDPLSR